MSDSTSDLVNPSEVRVVRSLVSEYVHDLRNILHAITTQVELARQLPSDKIEDKLRRAGQGALRAIALLEELEGLGAMRCTEYCTLGEIVREEEDRLKGMLGKQQILETRIGDTVAINVNRLGISRILDNLVKNASECSPAGSILIYTANKSTSGFSGRIDTIPAGFYAILSILDEGPGFPDGALETVCKRYVSTKGPGRGRGLSIVRDIARVHNGYVDVTSGPCAIFSVYLPIE